MSTYGGRSVECCDPLCAAKHPTGKWGNIRAHAEGWFESKDGKHYCPRHVPKWVKRWRTR